jgi:hypothetical protein
VAEPEKCHRGGQSNKITFVLKILPKNETLVIAKYSFPLIIPPFFFVMNVTIKENREEEEASHPCIQEWGASGCASIWNRILQVVVRIGLYLDSM